MKYNPDIHHRRSVRLKGFNYARSGAYFVTICTRERQCLFGKVSNGKIRLNDPGQMLQKVWEDLPRRFPFVELDQFTVMPNHVHGVIILSSMFSGRGESCIRPKKGILDQGDHKDRPYGTMKGTIGRIIQTYKSITTHNYIVGAKEYGWFPFPGKLWQRNYYEHIIRNEDELNRIRRYIRDNPLDWETDEENPNRKTIPMLAMPF